MELVPPEEKWLGLEGSDKPTCVDGGGDNHVMCLGVSLGLTLTVCCMKLYNDTEQELLILSRVIRLQYTNAFRLSFTKEQMTK